MDFRPKAKTSDSNLTSFSETESFDELLKERYHPKCVIGEGLSSVVLQATDLHQK